MPNIKGIVLHNPDDPNDLTGVKILSGEVNTPDAHYTKSQIETYLLSHDIAHTETQINNFLSNAIKGEQIRVHIFSASPLKVTCIVANWNAVIPDNWWQ